MRDLGRIRKRKDKKIGKVFGKNFNVAKLDQISIEALNPKISTKYATKFWISSNLQLQ